MLPQVCSYIAATKTGRAHKKQNATSSQMPHELVWSCLLLPLCCLQMFISMWLPASVRRLRLLRFDWAHCYWSCQLGSGKVFSALSPQSSAALPPTDRVADCSRRQAPLPLFASLESTKKKTEPHPCSSTLVFGKWSSARIKWSTTWEPSASESRNR